MNEDNQEYSPPSYAIGFDFGNPLTSNIYPIIDSYLNSIYNKEREQQKHTYLKLRSSLIPRKMPKMDKVTKRPVQKEQNNIQLKGFLLQISSKQNLMSPKSGTPMNGTGRPHQSSRFRDYVDPKRSIDDHEKEVSLSEHSIDEEINPQMLIKPILMGQSSSSIISPISAKRKMAKSFERLQGYINWSEREYLYVDLGGNKRRKGYIDKRINNILNKFDQTEKSSQMKSIDSQNVAKKSKLQNISNQNPDMDVFTLKINKDVFVNPESAEKILNLRPRRFINEKSMLIPPCLSIIEKAKIHKIRARNEIIEILSDSSEEEKPDPFKITSKTVLEGSNLPAHVQKKLDAIMAIEEKERMIDILETIIKIGDVILVLLIAAEFLDKSFM